MVYLGVHVGRGCKFRDHVETVTAEAAKTTSFLGRIMKCGSSIPAKHAVHAVKVCVIPVLMYGSEVWWDGKTQGKHGKIRTIESQLCTAANKAHPAWKGTSIVHLQDPIAREKK